MSLKIWKVYLFIKYITLHSFSQETVKMNEIETKKENILKEIIELFLFLLLLLLFIFIYYMRIILAVAYVTVSD